MPRTAPLVLLAAVALLGGCANAPKGLVSIRRGMPGETRLAAAPAIDIQNTLGSVIVRVDPRVTEPRVQASLIESKTGAKAEWAAAELSSDQGRAVLRVLSVPTHADAAKPTSIIVTVPGCSGIRVRNAGGGVLLDGVSGAIQVENGGPGRRGGSIIVTTPGTITDHVALETTEGDITLSMGRGSGGSISATATHGQPSFNSRSERLEQVHFEGPTWKGVLNRGDNPITLRTGRGYISMSAGK